MSDAKPFEAVRDYGQQHMGWPDLPDEPAPVNHKAEAERILSEAAAASPYTEMNDPHGAALVHATLYLAEQQRIANERALGLS